MNFNYTTGRYSEEEFDYSLDIDEIKEFIEATSDEDIVNASKKAYDNLTAEEKEELLEEFKETGFTVIQNGKLSPDWKKLVEDDRGWLITELILYDNEAVEYFEDDMKDSFQKRATNSYKDSRALQHDPYSYYGLNPADYY